MEKKSSEELVKLVVSALEDKKGEDIAVLDIHEVTVIADYFILATGKSSSQIEAMTEAVDEVLAKENVFVKHTEGLQGKNWILMDYGDIIVHIFDQENRIFYDLERIWKDGKKVSVEEL
ncbi:MAG: ribosome silencing factor [Lachnospiraceae bacterium]|nr:ribosome silencing factor [Lachnospiraceae bacterium]